MTGIDQNSDSSVLDALLVAIRDVTGDPTIDWLTAPQPLAGGFWAQMWRVSLNTDGPLAGELAARVMPDATTAARESEVQRYLAESGFPTPKVRLAQPPGLALPRAWMLMDFASGQPLLASLSGPSALARLPALAKALPEQLAHHAAALHTIDPSGLAEKDEQGLLDGEIADQLRRLVDTANSIGRSDLAKQAELLISAQPTLTASPVICHGDLHPFNILSGPEGDTVLDWSAAQIADPEYDLAYTHLMLSNPPLTAPGPLKPLIGQAGRLLARRFLDCYVRHSSRRIDHKILAWCTAVHCQRLLVDVSVWEHEGTVDQHPGHPYLSMNDVAVDRIQKVIRRI